MIQHACSTSSRQPPGLLHPQQLRGRTILHGSLSSTPSPSQATVGVGGSPLPEPEGGPPRESRPHPPVSQPRQHPSTKAPQGWWGSESDGASLPAVCRGAAPGGGPGTQGLSPTALHGAARPRHRHQLRLRVWGPHGCRGRTALPPASPR